MKKGNERMRSYCRRSISLVLALCLLFAAACVRDTTAKAASTSSVYNDVKGAYGSSFPLSDNNRIKTERKNIFGKYSTVLGVSAKLFSSYTAAQKSNSTEKYVCYICKATKKANVKKIKKAMKKFVVQEYNSNVNYLSDNGKKLLKAAKVGSKGKFVYLFVLDTAGNKKAIDAFKKSLS